MIYLPQTQVWTNFAYVHSSITLCLTWLPSGRGLILLLVLLGILLATLGPPGPSWTLMDPRHPRSFNMSKSPSWGLPKLGLPSKGLPSGNQTWLAGKSPVNGSFNRKISDQWSIFHGHVWLPEVIFLENPTKIYDLAVPLFQETYMFYYFFTHKNWLVVSTTLKNMSSSIGMMTFPVYGKI